MNLKTIATIAATIVASTAWAGTTPEKKCAAGTCAKKAAHAMAAKPGASSAMTKEASCSKKEASCSKKDASCSKKEASCSKKEAAGAMPDSGAASK